MAMEDPQRSEIILRLAQRVEMQLSSAPVVSTVNYGDANAQVEEHLAREALAGVMGDHGADVFQGMQDEHVDLDLGADDFMTGM